MRIIYECENCGKQSINKNEILKCESAHLKLTDEEYELWERLTFETGYSSYINGICKNEQSERDLDDAIKALRDFEQLHGINIL